MANWAMLLDRAERVHPDLTAIAAEGDTWTFADVARTARVASAGLGDLGIGVGDRVMVVARTVPEYLLLAGAVARAGAVLVSVNFRLSADEVAMVAMDSASIAVAADADSMDLVDQVVERVPNLRVRISLESTTRPGWHAFQSLANGEAVGPLRHMQGSDLARIMYTSGTTGRAKGVEVTHQMWVFNTMAQVRVLDVRRGDRILLAAPLHHVGGLDLPGLGAWMAGATLVLQRRFSAEESVELMRDQQITGGTLVHTMLHRLVRAESAALADLRLRWLQFGTLPVSLVNALRRLMPDVALIRGYGMTETLGGLCHNVITAESSDLTSVGFPLPFMEVRIVEAAGRECPRGTDGAIQVRGPKVTPGYFGDPEGTAEALRDGWLDTGDIGCLDKEGRLTITDRSKDLIRSGGESISSREVEEVLYRHPAVHDAAVVARPDEHWGEIPVAFVVTTDEVSDAELVEHCRSSLAGFKVPKQFLRVDDLPRNSSGKVAKPDLRARLVDHP